MKHLTAIRTENDKQTRRELAQLNEQVHIQESILGIPTSQDSNDFTFLRRRLNHLTFYARRAVNEEVFDSSQPAYPYA